MNREWIYGRQAVRETLRAGRRRVFQAQLAESVQDQGTIVDILKALEKSKIPAERRPKQVLDRLSAHHQGIAIQVEAYPYCDLLDLLSGEESDGRRSLFLILDVLQDPQNLGTLLRTAEAVGADGVLLPLRHTVGVTPSVVNASAGASEHLRIAQVNLAQAISALKEQGIWVAGLDSGEDTISIFEADLSVPIAIVVGGEGEGLRALVRKSCDWVFRIPMAGKVESLNAATAGSIALYRAFQSRTVPCLSAGKNK